MMNWRLKLKDNCCMPLSSIRKFLIIYGFFSVVILLFCSVLVTFSQMRYEAVSTYQRIALNIDRIDDFGCILSDADIVLYENERFKVLAGDNDYEVPLVKSEIEGEFVFHDGNLIFVYHAPIKDSDFILLTAVDFMTVFMKAGRLFLICSLMSVIIEIFLYRYIKKYFKNQKVMLENLISMNDKLADRLYHDGLTEVMTRSMFLIQAEKMLADHETDLLITLCFIDLDNLKNLNDTYGHQAGDAVLKQIGSILYEYEEKYQGAVGRYGGDEFILILRQIECEKELEELLADLAERLRFVISYMGEVLSISCSIGAVIWNQKDDLESLIAKADHALYEVKRHGKGDYLIFNKYEKN